MYKEWKNSINDSRRQMMSLKIQRAKLWRKIYERYINQTPEKAKRMAHEAVASFDEAFPERIPPTPLTEEERISLQEEEEEEEEENNETYYCPTCRDTHDLNWAHVVGHGTKLFNNDDIRNMVKEGGH